MPASYLTFKVKLPDDPLAEEKLAGLRWQFIETVDRAGGKVAVSEILPAFEDLGINRWIVDDCDTCAANGADLLMSLGNVVDDADNIFGDMVFEDEHGVLHKVITTWEIIQILAPEEQSELVSRFDHAADQTDTNVLKFDE